MLPTKYLLRNHDIYVQTRFGIKEPTRFDMAWGTTKARILAPCEIEIFHPGFELDLLGPFPMTILNM